VKTFLSQSGFHHRNKADSGWTGLTKISRAGKECIRPKYGGLKLIEKYIDDQREENRQRKGTSAPPISNDEALMSRSHYFQSGPISTSTVIVIVV